MGSEDTYKNSDIVINLVGILYETRKQKFYDIHSKIPEAVAKICSKHNIKIIEDASQAMGGKYKKKFIGNCKYSDLTVFSMHPVKSITSGEGGLILTNNEAIYKNLLKLRINGVDKKNSRSWEQDVNEFGFNYKISELNCALANSQLKRLNRFINLEKN